MKKVYFGILIALCLLTCGCSDSKTLNCTVEQVSATIKITDGQLESYDGTLNIRSYLEKNIIPNSRDTRHAVEAIKDYVETFLGGKCN